MTIIQAAILAAALIIAIVLIVYISSLIAKPLNMLKEVATNVADGNINVKVDYQSKDEIGNLADAFRSVIEALGILNINMQQLKRWATEGRILERVQDDERVKGAYREVVHGVNGIMDTFVNHYNCMPVGATIVDTSNNKVFANNTADAHRSIDKDNLQTQTQDMTDEAGRTLATLIVTVDQTTVMEAQRESERQAQAVATAMRLAEKRAEYQKLGMAAITKKIELLAIGNLRVQVEGTNEPPVDADTQELREQFYALDQSLVNSCTSISGYIDELDVILGSIANKNLNVGITRE
jgi:HAMP domain-containing protein